MPLWNHSSGSWKTSHGFQSHRGQHAFICCNGPSFREVDSSALKGAGRVVIGVNTTYPRLCPDWWIGMDDPECYEATLVHEAFPKVWRGNYGDHFCQNSQLKHFPNTHFMDVQNDGFVFPVEQDQKFQWLNNTFACAVQFAMWLGCHTLNLVGCDLSTATADYADGTRLTDTQREYNQKLYDEIFQWVKTLAAQSEIKGFRLRSCSDGSRLNEIMSYIHIYDALRESCEHLPSGRKKTHVLS